MGANTMSKRNANHKPQRNGGDDEHEHTTCPGNGGEAC